MNATETTASQQVWTEEELQALPNDGFVHEVVNGELVVSPKNNFSHGRICIRLVFALESYNRQHRLGVVLESSPGFWMHNRNCRAPDVSFITKTRLQSLGFRPDSKRFFPGAPDLAVEVPSPNNARSEIDARLSDFLSSGTEIAWIVDPENESVEVCYSVNQRRTVDRGGALEGEHLLPGFRLPVTDLFKEWDWE